ncbi:hypothetical protein [Kozakia baliensis]|uniref:hypothetical protein n=1 Tax=Kozakia baliensis TaxID=153496 RepID=UPI00049794CF|nr:hypothetical protein [Kozakia baliensis]
MSRRREMQILIRTYKEETGCSEIDMQEVAAFAARHGWPLPQPKSPLEMLAKQFADAARDEIGHDPKSGKPYRVYHAVPVGNNGQTNLFHWVDIREAPRRRMHKSLMNRREQMVGDGFQLTLDAMFWNSINPNEEPIVLPMDLTPDIEWRLNSPDEDGKAA